MDEKCKDIECNDRSSYWIPFADRHPYRDEVDWEAIEEAVNVFNERCRDLMEGEDVFVFNVVHDLLMKNPVPLLNEFTPKTLSAYLSFLNSGACRRLVLQFLVYFVEALLDGNELRECVENEDILETLREVADEGISVEERDLAYQAGGLLMRGSEFLRDTEVGLSFLRSLGMVLGEEGSGLKGNLDLHLTQLKTVRRVLSMTYPLFAEDVGEIFIQPLCEEVQLVNCTIAGLALRGLWALSSWYYGAILPFKSCLACRLVEGLESNSVLFEISALRVIREMVSVPDEFEGQLMGYGIPEAVVNLINGCDAMVLLEILSLCSIWLSGPNGWMVTDLLINTDWECVASNNSYGIQVKILKFIAELSRAADNRQTLQLVSSRFSLFFERFSNSDIETIRNLCVELIDIWYRNCLNDQGAVNNLVELLHNEVYDPVVEELPINPRLELLLDSCFSLDV